MSVRYFGQTLRPSWSTIIVFYGWAGAASQVILAYSLKGLMGRGHLEKSFDSQEFVALAHCFVQRHVIVAELFLGLLVVDERVVGG